MEACQAVEKEVNKVLEKFGGLQHHYDKNLDELINSIQSIQRELNEGPFSFYFLFAKFQLSEMR